MHGNRRHVDDILDFPYSSSRRDLPGFPRQFKVGHPGQRGNVRYHVVVDEKVSIVKRLLKNLAFKRGLIGVEQRVQGGHTMKLLPPASSTLGPVSPVGERVGGQRNPLPQPAE